MLDTVKSLLANQYAAALCTLDRCMRECPEAAWGAPVGNYLLGQVVFHALFYADLYLGPDLAAQREQPFHRHHQQLFGDYEELQDRAPQTLHDKAFVEKYMDHCRTKAAAVIASETSDSLMARCGFEWRDCSRAELHVYNIRHIQHHAAQLSLRLRLDADQDIPWIGSGWR